MNARITKRPSAALKPGVRHVSSFVGSERSPKITSGHTVAGRHARRPSHCRSSTVGARAGVGCTSPAGPVFCPWNRFDLGWLSQGTRPPSKLASESDFDSCGASRSTACHGSVSLAAISARQRLHHQLARRRRCRPGFVQGGRYPMRLRHCASGCGDSPPSGTGSASRVAIEALSSRCAREGGSCRTSAGAPTIIGLRGGFRTGRVAEVGAVQISPYRSHTHSSEPPAKPSLPSWIQALSRGATRFGPGRVCAVE